MKVQVNELRIGNYYSYDDDSIKLDGSLLASYLQNDTDLYLYPIKLTEEWLKKLGFNYDDMQDTYDNDNPWYHLKYRYLKFSSDKSVNFNKVYLTINKMDIICEYVHDLQNLYFALTGTELIITPK